MKTKPYKGYHISPGYVALTIWAFAANGERLRTTRIRPIAGLSRYARHCVLSHSLKNEGFTTPVYTP